MARPQRHTVDYFPFYCGEGKSNYYIEQKYGNDGFATWIKLLRELASSENHYIDLNDEVQIMFLSAKCKVEQIKLESIIIDLCKLGEFDSELWTEFRILFSEKFVESIEDAYRKRSNEIITKNSLFRLLGLKSSRKLDKSNPKPPKRNSQGGIKPQSKVKESKAKESKANKRFIPPTLGEVKKYFSEKGYREDSAVKFFDYYDTGSWKDSKGNPVKNWKQKALAVWFKEENKIPENKNQDPKFSFKDTGFVS